MAKLKKPERHAQSRLTQAFLWRLVKPYRWRLLGGSLLMVVSAGAMLSLPQYLRTMFDTALKQHDSSQLDKLAALMFLTVLVMAGSVIWRARLIQFSTNALLAQLRNHLSAHLLTLDMAYFETNSSGGIVSRLTSDTYALREFLTLAAPQLVRGILLGIGTTVALLYTSTLLTLVLLAAAGPIAVMGRVLGKKVRLTARDQQDNIAEYGAAVEETVANIRTIVAFNQQARLLKRFAEETTEMRELGNRRAIITASFVATNVIVGFMALIGVVWLGGLRVMNGQMSLGDMMAFLLYLAFMADAVGSVTNFWPAWQATLGATERVIALLHQKPTLKEAVHPQTLPEAKNGRALALENLSYSYPARPESPSLHAITATVQAGAHVAIVGPSGAGKSTLFRLLQRLDDPQSGAIYIDDIASTALSLAHLRAQFALVAQESPLFSGTVAENVTFSRPDATEEQIWNALSTAAADGFVKALPHGLHTQVGEKGVQLSGGQKQRLAIARAVLADAPVLLFDEATSHLDSESEAAIQHALYLLGREKTVITIAHRLSTVKAADVIWVLDKGRLVAQGTHAQLLKSSPLYNALATLQLQNDA